MSCLSTLRVWLLTVPFILAAPLWGSPTVIDFEGLPDGTVITNQFPGLTFSSAVLLTAGISLNEFEFPPFSGVNVISDDGGPITITFATPVMSVSGYFTYLTALTLTAYDSTSAQVDQVLSAYNSNLALSGDLGSTANELLTLNFVGGISRVSISGDPGGGSFTVDDLYATPVPEPPDIFLFLTATGLMWLFAKGLNS